MPVFSNCCVFLLQLPMLQAGQLLLVTGIAFAVITLIASTYRFHKMIQFGEDQLTSVEDCNDFFFIQVTRYLSKINRTSSGFGVLVIQFQSEGSELRGVQESFLHLMQDLIRTEVDKVCLFHEDCVAAIIDTEDENVADVARRITRDLTRHVHQVPAITAFRTGAAAFPTHGLTSRLIIDAATDALESVRFEDALPVSIAPQPSGEPDAPEPEATGELSKKDRNSAIDPLTGVLKPDVIGSYMRKYLSEMRQKKQPAAVLCVGINRIENIINLHGEEAADSVIAGVSQILQRLTRDSDLIGRYHRDDFLILAPCTLDQGEMISIRLREAVQKEVFLFKGKRIKASVSAGISAHPEHGRTLRELFSKAYTALEIVHEWDTSTCLVFDPAQHSKKIELQ